MSPYRRKFSPYERTYPSFLTRDEYLREQYRMRSMVLSIIRHFKFKESTKTPILVGHTENYVLKYDSNRKVALLFKKENNERKEAFRLEICKNEIDEIIGLLTLLKIWL